MGMIGSFGRKVGMARKEKPGSQARGPVRTIRTELRVYSDANRISGGKLDVTAQDVRITSYMEDRNYCH